MAEQLPNKKDWHILRNISEKLPQGSMTMEPTGRWSCAFTHEGVTVNAAVRIGVELWSHIAGDDKALTELCVALIRACVAPTDTEAGEYAFTIADLASIISVDSVPDGYIVSILQRSQLEWLFFLARHFCDRLTD